MVYKLASTSFGLQWYSGKDGDDKDMGPQRYVLSTLKDNKLVVKHKEAHHFAKVKPEKLVEILNRNHCIQEMVHPDRLSKVYFDVDFNRDCGDVTLDEVKAVIMDQFPSANLQICGYETDQKKSWHIVLSNYTATFKELELVKLFCMQYSALGFDAKVYTANRFMKCINQSKPKKTPGVYIEGSREVSKHLIQVNFDDNCVSVSTLSFDALMSDKAKAAVAKGRRVDFTTDIPEFKDVTIDPDFFFYDAAPLQILHNLPVSPDNAFSNDVTWRIMTWALRRGLTFAKFWAWTSQQDDSVQRMHKYQQRWAEIEGNNKYQVRNGFMEGIFYAHFPSALKSKALKLFNASLCVPATKTSPNQWLTCDDITPAKFNVLATGMGSSKTGAVCSYIAKFPDARLGFVNYRNVKNKKAMGSHKRLVISPCSLHYITEPYDMVVVDKSETVLQMFLDDKLHTTTGKNNLLANLLAFKTLCENGRGIFMDAFVTNLTMDVLRSFEVAPTIPNQLCGMVEFRSKIEVIKNTLPNTFKPRKMTYIASKPHLELSAEDIMERNIIADLRAGKKLYVFIPRKHDNNSIWAVQKFGEYLEKVMDWKIGNQIKVYHSGRPKHENKELENPDTAWGLDNVRVVILNLKITVGVNFSTEKVFHKVYARYESWFSARNFIQGVFRVRHPIDNKIVFMTCKGNRSKYLKRTKVINVAPVGELHQAIVKNAMLEREMAAVSARYKVFDSFRKLAGVVIDNCPDYYYEVDPKVKVVLESGWSFEWKNIEPAKDDTMQAYSDKVLDAPDWKTWLSIRKSFFMSTFKGLSEKQMSVIWDNNSEDFMETIKHFYTKDTDHVLHTLLAHNKMDLRTATKFNVQAVVPAAFGNDIKRWYKQLTRKACGNATLLSSLLNKYFGKKIVRVDPKQRQVMIDYKPYPNLSWTDNYELFKMYIDWTTTPQQSLTFTLNLDDDKL
ncbi:hypothetical protein H9P43_009104 [Blastocladiella emersonii ATCC 22665]|nr:hypothetical protein H9P43_009104 [Blastocladiella emersonii ATCC 22665]